MQEVEWVAPSVLSQSDESIYSIDQSDESIRRIDQSKDTIIPEAVQLPRIGVAIPGVGALVSTNDN